MCGAGEAKVVKGEGGVLWRHCIFPASWALDRAMGYLTSLSLRFFIIIPASDKTQQVVNTKALYK